jgi:3-dehydroquinate synthase
VDASIGGKTAVNHKKGRTSEPSISPSLFTRMSACFQPCLSRLPVGLAEVVKYGVIADEKFFSFLKRIQTAFTKEGGCFLLK